MLPISIHRWAGVIRISVCRPSTRPLARSITAKNTGSAEAAAPASQASNRRARIGRWVGQVAKARGPVQRRRSSVYAVAMASRVERLEPCVAALQHDALGRLRRPGICQQWTDREPGNGVGLPGNLLVVHAIGHQRTPLPVSKPRQEPIHGSAAAGAHPSQILVPRAWQGGEAERPATVRRFAPAVPDRGVVRAGSRGAGQLSAKCFTASLSQEPKSTGIPGSDRIGSAPAPCRVRGAEAGVDRFADDGL